MIDDGIWYTVVNVYNKNPDAIINQQQCDKPRGAFFKKYFSFNGEVHF